MFNLLSGLALLAASLLAGALWDLPGAQAPFAPERFSRRRRFFGLLAINGKIGKIGQNEEAEKVTRRGPKTRVGQVLGELRRSRASSGCS